MPEALLFDELIAVSEREPLPFWQGEQLASPLAFDTETDARCDLKFEVPRLALATVSDGEQNFIIQPDRLNDFLWVNSDNHWVCHHVAFDYWVLYQHLHSLECPMGAQLLSNMTSRGQLHDIMLLDMLVRIAKGTGETGSEESKLFPRNLAVLAKAYQCKTVPDKGSEFRLRYHELLDTDPTAWQDTIDPGFFSYALDDTRATWEIWQALSQEARQIAATAPADSGIYPDAEARYGLLTEKIQVLGSIALAECGRRGMAVDQQACDAGESELRQSVEESLRWLMLTRPKMFSFYKRTGLPKMQPKTGLPKLGTIELRQALLEVSNGLNIEPIRSNGKQKLISTSVKQWQHLVPAAELDDEMTPRKVALRFLKSWHTVANSKTTLGFFSAVKVASQSADGRAKSSYVYIKNTGRTGCRKTQEGAKLKPGEIPGINIQQIPKRSGFREMFVASPGHTLFICDYAAIELRTLAAICKARFGWSKLGDIFNQPSPYDDPHSYTASIFIGVGFEEFLSWESHADTTKKHAYATKRQAAKPVNFGVPGGLGGKKLVDYAAGPAYGVTLTLEEAVKFRLDLITKVYPEMEQYLSDNTLALLAHNLALPESTVRQIAQDVCRNLGAFSVSFAKILKGMAVKADGEPYKPNWVRSCWQVLDLCLARSPLPADKLAPLKAAAQSRETGHDLHDAFLGQYSITPTGRLRGGCRFTQLKNGPFQSLAADGAKLALWNLLQEGFANAAFIHDEIVVELVEDGTQQDKAREISAIMEASMFESLNRTVPIKAKGHLSHCWSK